MSSTLSENLQGKLDDLKKKIRVMPGVVVAFSGGVDSSVLLKVASISGCPSVLAVTAVSESFPIRERHAARRLAAEIGVRHIEIRTNELDLEAYRANRGDRCYFCRQTLFDQTRLYAETEGLGTLCYGAIPEDLGDDRPGMKAADEYGVRAPLIETQLSKTDIRSLAQHYGLDVWDKPASACLASRFPTGTEVTRERLKRVEVCEDKLAKLGLKQFRARFHDQMVRIELDAEGLERTRTEPNLAEMIVSCGLEAGFQSVLIDPQGYRMGSAHTPILFSIDEG